MVVESLDPAIENRGQERKMLDALQPWDLIDKVRFLEQKLGMRVSYRLLDPFSVDPRDPLSLNAAASRIASFVGLSERKSLGRPQARDP